MHSFQQRTQVNSPGCLGVYLSSFCDDNENKEGENITRFLAFMERYNWLQLKTGQEKNT